MNGMLYKSFEPKQQLKLRIPQTEIDNLVEGNLNCSLKCTHFDAFRFFHPEAKHLNNLELTREKQVESENGSCIHATMDLFKYAYILYPFVSSSLLQRCFFLAFEARFLDMRSSPYDVSMFEGCADAIHIETNIGRKQFVTEQKALYKKSQPIRKELLGVYDTVLSAST